jgi:branched-chain amino acid transport system ATP-binding protein
MLLKSESLVKRFGGIVAVDDVSFDLEAGLTTGIIGPNGAGKSTLFNLISGSYKPTAGRILFRGERIDMLPPHAIAKKGIGRTYQISRPFADMTVRENLVVSNYDLPRRERNSRIDEIFDLLDLGHQAETLGKNLSGGQQKLLGIARVLMLDPDLILLDEPAAGVNPQLVDRIANLIEETKDERTFLLVEHDITLVSRLCDRVIVLNEGQIIADGPIEAIRENPEVKQAYLGGVEV